MSPRAIGGRGSCHVARTWLITASWLVTERCTICWRVNTVLPQSSTRSLSFPGLTTVWSLHDCRDTVQISSVFLSANDQPFVCMRYGCAWIFYNTCTRGYSQRVTSRFQKGHLSYLRRTQLLSTVDRRGHFNPVTTDCVKTAQQFVQTVVESCILCITVSQHLMKTCFVFISFRWLWFTWAFSCLWC